MVGGGGGGGKEGDWECGGCHNRNYAFRSFCNRCKQPRLLVDNKTPADSKWLPRIGDWICTGMFLIAAFLCYLLVLVRLEIVLWKLLFKLRVLFIVIHDR